MLVLLLFLAGAVSLTVYHSSSQTLVAQQYLKVLAKKLNTKITVGKVAVNFFNRVTINDLYVEDQHQDTLLFVKELKVVIDEFSIKEKKIFLEKTTLNGMYFNLKKYATDTTNNMQFIVDYFTPKDTSTIENDWQFRLNKTSIVKGKFNYDNADYTKELAGVDYDHVSITYLNTELSEIDFITGGVKCNIDKMNFFEQSGFQMDQLKALFAISPQGIVTDELTIETPYSAIQGDIHFLTETYADMANFITDVTIKSNFDTSLISFKDICFFAPTLDCLNKSLTLDGEIKGSIANLKGKKLDILLDDGTIFRGSANISGIPNPEDIFMHINVKELITSKQKLEQFPLYPFVKETYLQLPDNFKHLKTIHFKGNFTGFYHDFVAYGKFKTALGDLTTDVAVKLHDNYTTYNGQLITDRFDMGSFFEMQKDIGAITMNVNLKGRGFSKEDMMANLEGQINQVVIKDYEYNNVVVKGDFSNQVFNGFLEVKDENISFDFDGSIDFRNKMPAFNFISNIKNAKLAKLHLVSSERQLKTRFSTVLKVNLVGNHIDNIVGDVEILNALYHDKLDSIYMPQTIITARNENGNKQFKIKSDVLDFDVEGKYQFSNLVDVAQNFITQYIPSMKTTKEQRYIENDFRFNLELHNSDIISKLFLKGINLSSHTSFAGFYNSMDQTLSINGNIPTADVVGINFNNASLGIKSNKADLHINFGVDKIYKSDSIYVNNFHFSTNIINDSILANINWKNDEGILASYADVSFNTFFKGQDYFLTKITNSTVFVANKLWEFNNDNMIEVDTSAIVVRNLSFSSNPQSILIDGIIADSTSHQLDIVLKEFDLLTIKDFIPKEVIKVEGIVNGVASISSLNKELLFSSNLNFNQFKINEYLIGKGEAKSVWNTATETLNIDGKFYRDHIPTILFGGNYYPKKEEESLDLNFELYQTELNIFDTYIKEHVSDVDGKVSAKLSITGNVKQPQLNGVITLQKPVFHVNYLNTTYTANLFKVNVTPDMISFDNVELIDEYQHKGYANGTIYHEWFTNWSLDLGLDVHNFLALNTTEEDNSLYYGKAYVTGLVNVGGYGKQMNIDVKVKSEKGTTLNIPLDDNENVEENNFIEFVSRDTTRVRVQEEIDLSNIDMNFDLELTPDAEIRLIFDEQIGDVMKSRGQGNIKLNINTNGELNMFGDYTIKDGNYLFTLQNVINKRFDLEEGGTISWNGSPYEAQLNITAVYRLRARLYDVLASVGDTANVYKKRIPVDLKLKMTDLMLTPDINFDINLPTADEDTKSKLKSILYVNNQQENIQELNRQVFSLLVLNRFLPAIGADATSGNANVGATTSSELLSNQLSNWLSKISNDFDIGVNYRPGDELSNQELELALSTQFFNDRLVVDGNLGVSDRKNVSEEAQQTNSLIGDVSIEYKITKDGKLRIKAFNTSNQFSLQNTNSPYTQGIGLFYKKEFDSVSEFFGKLFQNFNEKTK
ncbi:MAG: translocation/assembly module TamB [Vicingus serpentipes]|nr:translocation/assembly module TamB [Vicingus serpentipes]